jgi:NADP-dependent 3-hydroxy acid dehydrogenase YdfG
VVNNAGSFQAGFFEQMTTEAFRSQIETTLFGPVNVTRAVLPQMRAQRSGLVITISSTAGIAAGGEFLTAYAASKFASRDSWKVGAADPVQATLPVPAMTGSCVNGQIQAWSCNGGLMHFVSSR